MFLKDKNSGDLVEILSVADLIDPFKKAVPGRFHAGEEMGEPSTFEKSNLLFPSNEELPRCWLDPNYKQG